MKRNHLIYSMFLAVAVSASAFACSNDGPADPGDGGIPDSVAVGARMYVNNVDSSDSLRIVSRTDNRVSFIFYNSGAQPLDIESTSTLQLVFTPAGFASSVDVPGTSFTKIVTTQQNEGTKGQITLKLTRNGTTRSLGAYNAIVK